jgi:hypothetical protein
MSHIFISYSKQDIDFVHGQPLFTYRRIKDVEQILSQALSDLGAQAVI